MVVGQICLWQGAIVDIPAGFALCDGNNGTPDLRNRFAVGAGDTYDPDDTGGAVNHNHTFTSNVHSHASAAGPPNVFSDAGANKKPEDRVVNGTTNNGSSLPPFFALPFIMRV